MLHRWNVWWHPGADVLLMFTSPPVCTVHPGADVLLMFTQHHQCAQLTLGSPNLLVLQQISVLHVLSVLGAVAPTLFVPSVTAQHAHFCSCYLPRVPAVLRRATACCCLSWHCTACWASSWRGTGSTVCWQHSNAVQVGTGSQGWTGRDQPVPSRCGAGGSLLLGLGLCCARRKVLEHLRLLQQKLQALVGPPTLQAASSAMGVVLSS